MLPISAFCFLTSAFRTGAVAQLGEHLLCKQGVVGSIPISSTNTPQHRRPRESAVISIGVIEISVDLRDQSVP